MATKVFMEALSPTMEEGRLVKWLKAENDAVKSGDVLAEVETDKAIMELVARGDGVLRKRILAEGGTSPVGCLIGVIAAPDEDIASLIADAPTAAPSSPPAEKAQAPAPAAPAPTAPAAPPAPTAPSAPAAPAAPSAPAGSTQRTRSSPLARRLAAEKGLDLGSIGGSGPGGRIVKRDVEAAPGVTQAQSPKPQAPRPGEAYRDVPLTQIRKTIARRLS